MGDDSKPDFSNVQSGAESHAKGDAAGGKADFSNVESGVTSSESSAQSYTVVKGDSLSAIAKRLYGDGGRWRAIYDANRDQIDNPDLIHPGQVLKIP